MAHMHTHTYLRTVCATYECVVEILSDGWIYPLYAKAFTSIVICLKLKFWQMVSFLHLAQTHIRIHTHIYSLLVAHSIARSCTSFRIGNL